MKSRKFKKDTLLEVLWDDCVANPGWFSESYILDKVSVAKCQTVGYFFYSDKDCVIVSSTLGIERDGKKDRDYIIIPWGCITKVNRCRT
jgi:hypothetical protein